MKKRIDEPSFMGTSFKKVKVTGEIPLRLYVANRIKQLQAEKKMSSRELWLKSGISLQSSIARIRSGSNSLRLDSLYKICKALDCKSSDILPF